MQDSGKINSEKIDEHKRVHSQGRCPLQLRMGRPCPGSVYTLGSRESHEGGKDPDQVVLDRKSLQPCGEDAAENGRITRRKFLRRNRRGRRWERSEMGFQPDVVDSDRWKDGGEERAL